MADDSMRRFVIAILVSIAAVVAFVACQQYYQIRKVLTPAVIHSEEKNSPYSKIDGTTVHIQPYGATFQIPEVWLTEKPAPDNHVKNIFLSWDELNEVNRIDREPRGFDSEEADIINSVLPFEDCVAHVGDRGWGNGLWNDLQARVYITNLTQNEVISRLRTAGLKAAKDNFEKATLASSSFKDWEKHSFDILDAPDWSDFILGENLDFYIHPVNGKTVVFVFLHADRFENEIALLLNSFSWQNPYLNNK